jgi:serine/threonine protein kinase
MTRSHNQAPGGAPPPPDVESTMIAGARTDRRDAATVRARYGGDERSWGGTTIDLRDLHENAGDDGIDAIPGSVRYAPGQMLGAGGMGEVRLHVDRRIGRRVARKTLHAENEADLSRRRFLREARIQGQLEHPSIVPVYDLDVDEDGRPYFTMKRVHGSTLHEIFEDLRAGDPETTRRHTVRRLLSAFSQVCLAVHYAHTRSVLHRDLKPSNIMLGSYGEVYVLDWGIARVMGEPDEAGGADEPPASSAGVVVGASGALTVHGAIVGTLGYMAPEQILAKPSDLDARADIYALGAMLFEILTQAPLRAGRDLASVLKEVRSGAATRPSDRVADVPPELDALCAHCLALDPDDRPDSARELSEAVEHYLDGDHDRTLRRELAARHAASARQRIEDAPPEAKGTARIEALRESMKALALDADQEDAQRLLVDVLTGTSGDAPPEAQRELETAAQRARAEGARMGMHGLIAWLAVLPLAILIGVKSWPVVGATAATTIAAVLLTRRMHRRGHFGAREIGVAAVLMAAIVALTSSYLGPFALTPTCAATASLIFAKTVTRRERPLFAVLLSLGALAPFIAELTGVTPRAYAFEPDRIIIFARAIALPSWPTMAFMIYSTLSFTVLPVLFVGAMRDALSRSEQRHVLQAWYLRQLFPATAEGGARA